MGRPGGQAAYSEKRIVLAQGGCCKLLRKQLSLSPSPARAPSGYIWRPPHARPLHTAEPLIQGATRLPLSAAAVTTRAESRGSAFPACLTRAFPLFKRRKNSPNADFKEPSGLFLICGHVEAPEGVTREVTPGTRGPGVLLSAWRCSYCRGQGALTAQRQRGRKGRLRCSRCAAGPPLRGPGLLPPYACVPPTPTPGPNSSAAGSLGPPRGGPTAWPHRTRSDLCQGGGGDGGQPAPHPRVRGPPPGGQPGRLVRTSWSGKALTWGVSVLGGISITGREALLRKRSVQ